MKLRVLLSGAMVCTLIVLTTTACPSKKEDHAVRDLQLLHLLSNSNGQSLEQQQTAALANAATGAANTASSSGGMTASNTHHRINQMVAAYLQNGKDPVFFRSEMQKILKQNRKKENDPRLQLAAINHNNPGEKGTGNVTYNYTGSIEGMQYEEQIKDISLENPHLNATCNVTSKVETGAKGTATFTAGVLTFAGSGGGDSFSGTASNSGSITFADYGMLHQDQYNLLSSGAHGARGSDCASVQNYYETLNQNQSYLILNGDVDFNTSTSFSNSSSGGASSSSLGANYSTTINSSTGLDINGTKHIFSDLKYGQESEVNINVEAGTVTGSFKVTMSGTLDGVQLNDSMTINF